jgi:hypothetical protein
MRAGGYKADMSLLGQARTTTRPERPRSGLLHGRLYRHGLWPATEASWLDQPGEDDVLVRVSRGVGLPAAVPAVDALALRIPVGGGRSGDLLLAASGGLLTRYVLGAARPPQARTLTTVLPYRAPTGSAVTLSARANGVESFELSCATEDGDVRVFADLRLSCRPSDASIAFDPLRHRLPGLEPRPGAERMRFARSA